MKGTTTNYFSLLALAFFVIATVVLRKRIMKPQKPNILFHHVRMIIGSIRLLVPI